MAGKKPDRKRHSSLKRELANFWPPAPRDAVALPLVDDLTTPFGGLTPEGFCNGCPAAEFVNKRCMFVEHGRHHIRNIFGSVKHHSAEVSFGDAPKNVRHAPAMPKKDEFDPYDVEVGARLRRTRKALGYEQIAPFAHDTGTDADNLGNWERGVSLVPPEYVRGLKSRFGVRFDWIYDEDAALMRPELSKSMLTVDRKKAAPRKRR